MNSQAKQCLCNSWFMFLYDVVEVFFKDLIWAECLVIINLSGPKSLDITYEIYIT